MASLSRRAWYAAQFAAYIFAPQGAGKSRNATALQAMFGCSSIVDDWDGESAVPEGALVLTNCEPVKSGEAD